MEWQVYIILCSDGSLYTGITNDLARRFSEHGGKRGAKYFRGRRPQQLVYFEPAENRSSATRRELEIKRLPRAGKLELIAAQSSARR